MTSSPTSRRSGRGHRSTSRSAPRRPTLLRVVGVVFVVLVVSFPATSALGQETAKDAQSGELPVGVIVPDDRLLPTLRSFEVEGDAYERAYGAWAAALREIASAKRDATRNLQLVRDLGADRVERRDELEDTRALLRSVVFDLGGIDGALRTLLVSSYTRGGPVGQAATMFDVGVVTDELYLQTLESEVGTDHVRRRLRLRSEIAALEDDIEDQVAQLGALADRAAVATAVAEERTAYVAASLARLPALERVVRDARITAKIVDTDLPLVALDAYLRAAATLAVEKPGCGIQWHMIAALARIESKHGSVNGSTLRPDGRTTGSIIGIALTGENGTALIADTEDGTLDGDAEFDRAVGPMQFIPTTWASFRRDGNGDRNFDPHNIYDASLAAAAYLCGAGRNLATNDGLRAAFLAYNRSSSYVSTGVENMERYKKLAFPEVPVAR